MIEKFYFPKLQHPLVKTYSGTYTLVPLAGAFKFKLSSTVNGVTRSELYAEYPCTVIDVLNNIGYRRVG